MNPAVAGNSLSGRPLLIFRRNRRAAVRLFCFHYAGGSASIFRNWTDALPDEVELAAVQLPGHLGRYGEPLIDRAPELIEKIYAELRPEIDRPYCLFGHSMGALLAYEFARLMQLRTEFTPAHLIVSAKRAPHLPRIEPMCSHLPTEEFIAKIREYDGTPPEVLQDAHLVDLLLPIWRADLALAEHYEHLPGPQLQCPITVLGARDDRWDSERDMQAWRRFTAASFALHVLEGGHFFLHSASGRAHLLQLFSAITLSIARELRS